MDKKDWLMIITNRFPHAQDSIRGAFVKEQVMALSKYFIRITVVSLTPYVPNNPIITPFITVDHKKDALAKNYVLGNIDVHYPKPIVLPPLFTKKRVATKISKWIEKKIINKHNHPDIIHAHFSWPSGFTSIKLKEKINIPVILTIHENHDWLLKEESDDDIIHVWNQADALIRVNKLDAPILKKYNDNVYSIPNGYSPDRFKPMDTINSRKVLKLPEDKFIIFTLGQLVERKGFKDLIGAAKLIREKRSDFLIIIGGMGPLQQELENEISKHNLTEHIHLIGYVPEKDVPVWINAANLFVLPSYSEGNPTVMFETLGCGIPFIGTTVGGVPEIINDEKLGILFPPGDIERMASAIISALETNWDNDYIYNTSHKYSWHNIAGEIMSVYTKTYKPKANIDKNSKD